MLFVSYLRNLPGGSEVKASACNVGDLGLIPGSGRSPGEGNGNPLQCSCLENPRDRGAWWAAIYGVAQSRSRLKQLSSMTQVVKDLPAVRETWVRFLGWEDLPEEGMATHSSNLAWRIPWTEEPGRLQSIGLQSFNGIGFTCIWNI